MRPKTPGYQEVKIEPITLTHEMDLGIEYLENMDCGGILISFIIQNEDGDTTIAGSGVFIAPGIALTAAHIFKKWEKDFKPGWMFASGLSVIEGGMRLWRMQSFSLISGTDLALIGLILGAPDILPLTLRTAAITTRYPKVGEELLIVGSHSTQECFSIGQVDEKDVLSLSASVLISKGQVTHYFPLGFGICKGYPVVEVDCSGYPGMSGAPVFDKKGMLIGILSASTADMKPSYVSILLPALVNYFEGGWPDEFKGTILDNTLCAIDRRDSIIALEDGQYEFTPWEE